MILYRMCEVCEKYTTLSTYKGFVTSPKTTLKYLFRLGTEAHKSGVVEMGQVIVMLKFPNCRVVLCSLIKCFARNPILH